MTRTLRLASLLVALLLSASGCGSGSRADAVAPGEAGDAATEAEAPRLEHDGVLLELPPGWHGRVLPLDYPAAVLQAANFAFAPAGVELPPGEEDPIKAMTAEHALVTVAPCGLTSHERERRPAPARLTLDELAFLRPGHPRMPRGHAVAHDSFAFSGRCLRVEVDFGGAPPAAELEQAVDAVLRSLVVAER